MGISRQHRALLDRLMTRSSRSWSEAALIACLKRLASGGPTDGHLITVHDTWPVADADGISETAELRRRHERALVRSTQ